MKIKMWNLIFLLLSVFISCFINLFFASFVPYVFSPDLSLSLSPPIYSVSSSFSSLILFIIDMTVLLALATQTCIVSGVLGQ